MAANLFPGSSFKGSQIVMGVSGGGHPALSWLTHCAGLLGFAAGLWLYFEDLQLRRQLGDLREEVADIRSHCPDQRRGGIQSGGWGPEEPPSGTWTGKGKGREGLDLIGPLGGQNIGGGLVQGFLVIALLVVVVLLIYQVCQSFFRKRAVAIDEGGTSPPHQIPDIARRQLAEVQLRRNGFGR